MSNPTFARDLLDVRLQIERKLFALGWIDESMQVLEPRLISWAIACCEHAGIPPKIIHAQAARVAPNRQWWLLRQFLPVAAFLLLESKLDTFLQGDSHG